MAEETIALPDKKTAPTPLLDPAGSDSIALPDRRSPLEDSYRAAAAVDPERAAKVLDLSRRLKEPESFIDKNLPQVQAAADAPSAGFWADFEQRHPESSKFLADQRNMAVAKDDFDKLGQFESLVKQVTTGFPKGNLEARQAELWAERLAETRQTGALSTKHEAELQKLTTDLEPYLKTDESLGKNSFHPVYQFASQIPNMTRAFFRAGTGEVKSRENTTAPEDMLGAGDVRGAIGATGRGRTELDITETVGPAAETAAAGAAVGTLAGPGGAATGAKLGAVAGMARYAYQLEAGNAFKEYAGLRDKVGNPIAPRAAADAAHTVGMVNAALETAGDLIMMKVVAPVGKALGSTAVDGAVKALSKIKVPGAEKVVTALTKSPKVFEGMTLGKAIREAGKLMALGEVGEMSTEYVQEVSTGLGREGAMSASGQEFTDRKSIVQIAQDSTGVLYPTFQSMLIPGLAGGGAHVFNSVREMKQAEAAKQAYMAMGQAAEGSKLRERLPDAHKSFVDQVTKGSPAEAVFIPVDAAETYFQTKGIDPRAAAEELGVASQYQAAKETGGDLRIPMPTWIEKALPSEHFKGLADDVKFSPESLTVNQAKAREAQIETFMQAEQQKAQEAIQKDAEKKQGYDKVFNYIKDQQIQAGRPAEMNAKQWTSLVEKNAEVTAAHAVAESARRGITVDEYFTGIVRPLVVPGDRAGQATKRAAAYNPEVLNRIRSEIEAGEHTSGGFVPLADAAQMPAGVDTAKAMPSFSTFPEYFKDKGYTKAETLSIIDKQIEGKPLTERQQAVLSELYTASGYDPSTARAAEEPLLQYALTVENGNQTAEVFKNPRPGTKEWREILGEYGDGARAFLVGGDVFMWDSLGAIHHQVGEQLKPGRSAIPVEFYIHKNKLTGVRVTDYSQRTGWDHNPGVVEAIKNHPFVKKYADTDFEVSFWDETIVGDWADLAPEDRGDELFQSGANRDFAQHNPPSRVAVTNLGDGKITAKEAQAAGEARFLRDDVVNAQTGMTINIAQKGVNRTRRTLVTDQARAAFLELDHLLERAVYEGWEPTKNDAKRGQIKAIHYFYAPVKYGDTIYPVRIEVRETNEGEKFYHQLVAEKGEPAGKFIGSDLSGREADSGLRLNISDLVDLVKSEREVNPLFQDDSTPRASVTFTPDGSVIKLFAKADASSFLHEESHIWLKDMHEYVKSGKANEKYLADWKTLSSWLGVTENQTEITRDQQEQFARGFEAYLLEGKAPSDKLKKAFASFRRWLTQIYKSVAGLNVELSDEVRGVMDRMLASEDEIAHAEESMGESSAMDSLKLPPELRTTLDELREQAHEDAVSGLLSKQMEELSKANKERFEKELAAARKGAAEQARTVPIYKAMAEAAQELKATDLKEAAKRYSDGKLSDEHSTAFDLIAETNGFSSGAELARAIQSAMPEAAYVDGLVEMRMIQFDDLRDTSAIKDEALRLIHNEKRIELMAHEKAALDSMIDTFPDKEAAAKRRAVQAAIDAQAARQKARELIAHKPIHEATAFLPYFTAERNEASAVARAIEKKDYQEAALHKQRQMLNHALAMESFRVKKVVEKWVGFLEDTRAKRLDLFKAEEHFGQVAMILERFGLPRKDFDASRRQETLKAWSDRMQEVTGNVSIPDWVLDETKRQNYKDLTLDEMEDVVNTLKNVIRTANLEKHALTIMNGAKIEDIVAKLAIESEKNTKPGDKTRHTAEPGKFDALSRGFAQYSTSLQKISTILRRADGWKDFGVWQQAFSEPIYKAANQESAMMRKMYVELEKIWGAYTKEEREEMASKVIYFDELGASATKMRILAMALNVGNAGNRDRLFSKSPVWAAPGIAWNESVVNRLFEKHLTAKDWEFVQNTWDMIGSLWPDISKLHKELTGFTPGRVEALPFMAKAQGGQQVAMKGGYYPLKEDYRSSEKANVREQLDQPLYSEKNPGWLAVTKTGHTKERVQTAAYAVALDITLINRHLRDVIHDLAFRPAIIDLRRLVANEQLQGVIKTNMGEETFQNLKAWVASVATGTVQERQITDAWEKVVRTLRTRTTQAVLMLKPSVIIQNFANPVLYANAVEGFGNKESARAFFARGLSDYIPKAMFNWKAAQEIRDFVYSKSSFMRDKRETPDFSLQELNNKMFGKEKNLSEFAQGLMAATDDFSNIPMWLEAYHKQLDATGDEQKSVQYADTLIERVTGSSRKYDQAGYQRGSEIAKATSMFYSFMNTEFNRWVSETGMASADIKNMPRFLGFVGARLLVFVPLSAALSAKGPGHGDEPWKWWTKEVLSFPIGFFPGGREVAGVFLDHALGIKSFGYRPSPAVAAVDAAVLLGKTAARATSGKASGQELAEATAKAASFAYPYPDQLNQWFFNAYDWTVNGMAPKAEDLYRRRPKKER